MDAVFYIFVAACSHGMDSCTDLQVIETQVATQAACDARIERTLMDMDGTGPVMHAECRPVTDNAMAEAPLWWTAHAPRNFALSDLLVPAKG